MFDPRVLIELLGCWLGGFRARELGDLLGLSRETAQRTVIADYARERPGRLRYDDRRRMQTFAGNVAELAYAPYRVLDVVNLLSAVDACARLWDGAASLNVPVEDVSLMMDLDHDAEIVRGLLSAIARRHPLSIAYQSKKTIVRGVFSPHTLVRTQMRLHFRGWLSVDAEHSWDRFVDLVPGRFLSIEIDGSAKWIGDAEDAEWRRRVSVVASVNGALPVEMRESIALEHGGERIAIRGIRAAVAPYVVGQLAARRVRGVTDPVWVDIRAEEP